jgi:integrase
MPRLTAKFVESAKAHDRRIEIPDSGCAGLYLILQPTGRKSWALRYRRPDKRPAKLTFDGFPSLADARRRAATALHELEQGRDPAKDKFEARRLAAQADAERKRDTVEQLVAQFLDEHVRKKLRPNSRQQVEHIFNDFVMPAWRGRVIHDVQRRDVRELVKGIASDRPIMANRALAALSKFFGWLCEEDVIAASPCVGVKMPSAENVRDRFLDDEEIVSLWKACDAIGNPAGACFKTLLLLGQRRGEIAGMRRPEIDAAGVWHVPQDRMKGKRAHALPLPPQVQEIIAAMPVIDNSDFVFTATGHAPLAHFGRMKAALDARMAVKAPWHTHDLRRTLATGMARIGVPVTTVEKILAHRSGTFRGIVGTYQQHSFIPEMRAALEKWAEHVDELVNGKPAAKVIKGKFGRRR